MDAGFDEYDIPYDVLWLDIEHTNGKKYFTWDSGKFPNPVEMQNKIAAKGRKVGESCEFLTIQYILPFFKCLVMEIGFLDSKRKER